MAASCGSGSDPGGTSNGGSTGLSSGSSPTGGTAGGTAGADTSSTGPSGAGPSGGNVEPTCKSDADCAQNPQNHHVCDTTTGDCIGCLPAKDMCPEGQYCDPATNTCAVGCTDASDCNPGGVGNLFCETTTHSCVGCLADTDCPIGSVCSLNQICIQGCSDIQSCEAGLSCCEGVCNDLGTDENHCGGCKTQCPAPPNAVASCTDGMCGLGTCNKAYADCNGTTSDGCEWNILQDGPCLCVPGSTQSCYQGAPGTEGQGPCKSGTRTCDASGTAWGPCAGQVLPFSEICGNAIDDDCNGVLDDAFDIDGDGWTPCNGDCCESAGPGCATPKLVNPGAFEVLNNGIDDDCDASTSDTTPTPPCSTAASFTGVTAAEVAKAMEICQTTTTNAPLPQKKWGLIVASHLLASGGQPSATALSNLQDKQTAILTDYGIGGIVPHKGPTMAGISSGVMRDQGDLGFAGTSTALTTSSQPPMAYLAAHNNALPSSAGCSGNCPAGSGANDSVNIRLQIRVPTNAKSFSYDFRFASSEYWSFQCTQFNDFYLALIQTTAGGIPADKNISFDSKQNPISVNNGFFEVCVPKGCNLCPAGADELAGTGLQLNNAGGATSWLTTDAPIVPGETMQLELMIFDVSDHLLDSSVLLDNFRWNLNSSAVSTHQ
jgi:hypothetical protein